MTFLDEALLGFLAVAAIPIIIHLLNRRNFKIVDWAAIRFLLDSMQKNSRRLQLRDIILLILRTLAIVLVVLAIARPLLSTGSLWPGAGGANVVILLDNSMSMSIRRGADTRFDEAKRAAENLIATLPRGSQAAVIAFNTTSRTIARPSHDLSFVREAIVKARPTDGGTNLPGALAKAAAMLQGMHSGGTIYLISDMQRNAFPTQHGAAWSAWISLLAEIHAQHNVHLVAWKIGRHTPAIISIDRLALSDPLVHADSPISLIATVVNHGPIIARNVLVSLYSGTGTGKLSKVASTVIPRLDHVSQVAISTRVATAGMERMEMRLSPQPLPACGTRRMTISVMKHLRILLVDGGQAAPQGPGPRTDGAMFIRAALAANDRSTSDMMHKNGSSLIRIKTIRMEQLAGISLTNYQTVIFSDVARIPTRWAASLHSFVHRGGTMIIFVGPNVQPMNYQSVLLKKAGLLPAALTKIAPLQLVGRDGLNLQIDNLSHPIFSFFKNQTYRTFLLQPVFKQAYGVDWSAVKKSTSMHQASSSPIEATQTADNGIIARFSNGMPAILTRRVGRGTVVLFTTSAGKHWSNFPLCPAFVMVLRRTLLFAVQSSEPQLNGTVGIPMGVRVPSRFSTVEFAQYGPSGSKTVPPTAWANGRTMVMLSEAERAGFYSLSHEPLSYTFAMNWPALEASVRTLSVAGLRAVFPGLTVQVVSGSSARSVVGNGGLVLWPVFLAMAVACLLAESILALYWAPEELA